MEKIIIMTFLFAFFVSVIIFVLTVKLMKAEVENRNLKNYIRLAINEINRARYGIFQTRLDLKNDKCNLYKSLNNLFESITDRDLVINEYREREKENYNLKEEFIAALTHDLKVPIIAQDKTYTLFLEDKFGKLNEIQKDVISKLKESNTDLKEMVNSILETYKIENTGVQLKIEKEINVNEFLKNTLSGLKNVVESAGKKINYHPSIENIDADFDIFLIKRVINNLIINALNHSKTTDKIEVFLNKTGDTFSIDVVDFGDGIDEKEIEKIFNKYYSITNKSARISSGLGLYLSNKIIKKHKGVIEVESKKNEGSIFRVILPLKYKD